MGVRTKRFASLVNIIDAIERTKQTNRVLHIERIALIYAEFLVEKKAVNSALSEEKN
jgi:hypothetical protein